jgi:hypothetical protein
MTAPYKLNPSVLAEFARFRLTLVQAFHSHPVQQWLFLRCILFDTRKAEWVRQCNMAA